MDSRNSVQKKTIGMFVFVMAVILMVIRVDWWWWGTKVEPLVFGWLSYPMLYHLLIWLIGYGLVAITVKYLWVDPGEH